MQINFMILGLISGTVYKYLSLVMVVLGYGLRYWINSRRFNRRNFVGLEEFRSYTDARFITLMERIVKLVGALLMIGGIIIFLLFWLTEPKKKSVQETNAQGTTKSK